jgi:uncharacterized coiled-coil protein SlyX/DNA-binding Xre family transcriptional regulator
MKPKNELFMDAIEWLIDNGLAENQGDIAVKAGLGPNLISRIKNGHVKAVSDDAIRALCDRFRELNIDYLRGKSDCISRQQQNANSPHEPRRHSAMDDSFLLEKQFQKVYDGIAGQYIAEQKDRINELNDRIAEQSRTISRLEKDVEAKDHEISLLKARLNEFELATAVITPGQKYPFEVGVSETKDQPSAKI